jgi:hypothetical protein
MISTPTGRKIRWITNRLLRSAEVYWDTQSQSFDLTAGEFDLNDQDKSKSTGVLYPLCQLAMDKEGQLQFELNQNPWKLVDVIEALRASTSFSNSLWTLADSLRPRQFLGLAFCCAISTASGA